MAKIDVIMGVYNGGPDLRRAIECILGQTLRDIRLLIMNDGSTDDSWNIMKGYAEADDRVVLYSQDNAGLGKSLNALIEKCNAPYIARMDADDVSLDGRLAAQYEFMEKNMDVGLAATWSIIMQSGQSQMGCQCYPNDHDWLSRQLEMGRNVFVHSSVVMRADVLKMFKEPYRFRLVQDYDLWLRISEIAKVGMIEEVQHVSYFHSERISGRGIGYRRELHNAIRCLGVERRSGQAESSTAGEVERRLGQCGKSRGEVSLDNDWYTAMNAMYCRNYSLARRHFLFTFLNNRSMRPRALKWLVATSLPGGHRLLSRLYGPLVYVKPLNDVVDEKRLTAISEILGKRDLYPGPDREKN